ncbi:hypothetical protein BXP70_28600 [Hymenobacter crusticola]|uniref:DUF4238 domain-containing protein n=1 Tax=Hymenobacter crusticola TaxID=1770526 RepID=A0A243W511_9BACT|nr:hypothetical protein BXP70_28600 [Hymenobacter crusticola]
MLSVIADDKGSVIEIYPHAVASSFKPEQFKNVSIGMASVFKGFCNQHDTMLFHDIENVNTDFRKYKDCLLLAYRTVVAELIEVDNTINFQNRLRSDLRLPIKMREYYKTQKAQRILAKKDCQFFKRSIEEELDGIKNNSFSFGFIIRSMPKLDIAASFIHGSANTSFNPYNINAALIADPASSHYIPASNPVFINLIPRNDHTVLVMGSFRDYKIFNNYTIKDVLAMNDKDALKIINYFLLATDGWFMSRRLFDRLSFQDKIEKMFEVIKNFGKSGALDYRFNIFDGIV